MLDGSGPVGQTPTSTAPTGPVLGAVAPSGSFNVADLPLPAAAQAIFAQALVLTGTRSTASTACRRLAVRVLAEAWDGLPPETTDAAYALMFRLHDTDEPEANLRFGAVLRSLDARRRLDRQYASEAHPLHHMYEPHRKELDAEFALALDAAVR